MSDAHDIEPTEADETPPVRDVARTMRAKGELPPFTKNFPDDPELQTLVVAFEQGRYDVVRDRAPRLAKSTEDPEVARAARELRDRLEADPLAVKLLVGVLVLLVLLTSWAYLVHRH